MASHAVEIENIIICALLVASFLMSLMTSKTETPGQAQPHIIICGVAQVDVNQ